MATVKCVVLGDHASGKTTLFQSYVALSKGKDLTELTSDDKTEVPESSDNYAVMKLLDNDMYFLSLFNTSGQEDNEEAMKVFYLNTGAFILCFSVTSKDNMQSIKDKWVPAIKEACPDAPFLLVGTKTDLKDDDSVSKEAGQALAEEVGALKYMECCAMTQEGVEEVFDAGLEAGKGRAERSESAGILAVGDTPKPEGCVAREEKKYPAPKPPKAATSPAKSAETEKVEEAEVKPEQPEEQKPEEVETKVEETKAEVKEEKEEEKKEENEEKKDKKKKKKGCTIL